MKDSAHIQNVISDVKKDLQSERAKSPGEKNNFMKFIKEGSKKLCEEHPDIVQDIINAGSN